MANTGITVIIAGKDNSGQVLEQLQQRLAKTSASSSELNDSLAAVGQGAKRALEIAGVTVALDAVIGKMKETIAAAGQFGEKLQMASTRTGLSVSTLSTLHYAAALAHTDFDQLSSAVGKLGGSLAQAAGGDKNLTNVFKNIGVNAKELAMSDDGVEVALKKVASAMAATESPAERLRLAKQLLGKTGQELIPVLLDIGTRFDQLSSAADRAGVKLNEVQAGQLAAFDDKLDDLEQRAQGVGLALASGLTPALEHLIDVLNDGQGSMAGWRNFGSFLGANAELVAAGILQIASAIEDVAGVSAIAVLQLTSFGIKAGNFITGGNIKGASNAAAAIDDQSRQIAEALDRHRATLADASSGLAQSGRDGLFGKSPQPRRTGVLGFIDQSSTDLVSNALKPAGVRGGGYVDTGDPNKAADEERKKNAANEKLEDSRRKITDATAEQQAAEAKSAADRRLSILADMHKRMLVSDEDYAVATLAVQKNLADKQIAAAQKREGAIDAQITALKNQRPGNENEENIRQAKINDLTAERMKLETTIQGIVASTSKQQIEAATAAYEAGKRQLAISDELAAKREAAEGGSTAYRKKQINDQAEDDVKAASARIGSALGKGDSAGALQAFNDLDNIQANRRRDLGSVDTRQAEEDYNLGSATRNAQRSSVDQAVEHGTMSDVEARRERIALDLQDADALAKVRAAWQALANEGVEGAKQKVIELGGQMDKLKSPVDKAAQHMRESFDGAFEGLFENLDQGTKAFENFAKDVERILMQAVYKNAIEPSVQALVGSIFPDGSNGVPFKKGQAQGGGSSVLPMAAGIGDTVRPFINANNSGTSGGGIGSFLGSLFGGGGNKQSGQGVTVTIVDKTQGGVKLDDIAKLMGQQNSADTWASHAADSFSSGGILYQLVRGII